MSKKDPNLALAEREVEALSPVEEAILQVKVQDNASYELADRMLSEAARHKADIVAKRKEATGGAYKTIKTIEGWFRPAIKILDRCEAHLKSELSAYRVKLEAGEREARAKALEAAQAGEHGAMTAALQVASDASGRPPGRSAATFEWRAASVDMAKLPRAYCAPDWDKIRAEAKTAGDEPPTIPGVTFERNARISARK